MNKQEDKQTKLTYRKTSSGSFANLIREALGDGCEHHPDYERFRTTYVKAEYQAVFPPPIVHLEPCPPGARGARKQNFIFSINKESVCFVRNLWFAFRFFSKLSEVQRFLTPGKSEHRRKMFGQRLEELKALTDTYAGWAKEGDRISQRLEDFNASKTDLLAVSKEQAGSTKIPVRPQVTLGSASAADFIRKVEQRASYQTGNPEDSCEKALYFLALGRPEIGEVIAAEVLHEHPANAVALYTNAVFLLSASERHQKQAVNHDVMHPHDLEPIEAEEFYHAHRHAEESIQARRKEADAFLLMLKASRNWPERFSIKCYDLSPSMWRHKVDQWIYAQAATRIANDPTGLGLIDQRATKIALKGLAELLAETWKNYGRSMVKAPSVPFYPNFITVAARVNPTIARDCLGNLENALRSEKHSEIERRWRESGIVFPIAQEPTLPEKLFLATVGTNFVRAVFSVSSEDAAAGLLRQIAQIGLNNGADRKAIMRSLAARSVILNIGRGDGLVQAAEMCRDLGSRPDWPPGETGDKLKACWRYGAVLFHFEASRMAFESGRLPEAAKSAGTAIELSGDWFSTISGELPLVKYLDSDENGETETVGDFFSRRPNIITDVRASASFHPVQAWRRSQSNQFGPWSDFLEWADREVQKPQLLAYGCWLSMRSNRTRSLSKQCELLAAKLDSLK
jgi:hypothetical protein